MKDTSILVVLIPFLFCGCGRDSKTPVQPSTASPVQPLPTRASENKTDSDSEEGTQGLGDYVSFPSCGIKIRQPDGFEKADSFEGFGQPGTQASVIGFRISAPHSKIASGFMPEQMKARGWTLHSKQEVKVDGLPGELIHFEQPAGGQVFLKWSLVFGDEKQTTMVTATFPIALKQDLSARLKAAVLSTRLDQTAIPKPETDLDFTLVVSPKLKFTPGISKMLVYTKDGVIPAKSPKDPVFIAAPAIGKVVVGNKRQFAEQRLRQIALTKKLTIKSTEAITIAGLDGYESFASAEDAKSGTPLIVYQVILFSEGSYFLIQGLVGTYLGDEYLLEFKAMARSLKKKQP